MKVIDRRLLSKTFPSQFYELNNFLIEATMQDQVVVPIDMPEVLLRMKIGYDLTLSDLEDIFNSVCNKVARKECVPFFPIAIMELYPEIFLQPRDAYMNRMLYEICNEFEIDPEDDDPNQNILVYTGNLHVRPLARLWNTHSYNQEGLGLKKERTKGGRKVLK